MWSALQKKTEEDSSGGGGISHVTEEEDINMAAPNNNKENNILALRSPILSTLTNNNNIRQFETDVLQRQAEYSGRISDLEGRLASFHSKLAVESAERGREVARTMEEYVDGPIEQAVRRSLERIDSELVMPVMHTKRATENNNGEQESSGDKHVPNLVAIERKTNHLEALMNHHKHVTLFQSRRQNFDTINDVYRKTLQPALALEVTKADKREEGIIRSFDSSSGEYTRLAAELASSRVSELGYIEKEIDSWDLSDLTRAEHYLQEIQKLKQRILDERAERMKQDELVVERIVQTRKMLEKDIFLTC